MDALSKIRAVLVHDWLTGMRGGEKCLEPFCRLWPDADLFTLLHVSGKVSPAIERLRVRTSFLQHLPRAKNYYRWLLPLMPMAANWRLPECELVLSFSHCVAKAARPPLGVPHVCYCFTPMRYAWHMRDAYFARERHSGLKRAAIGVVLARLRDWDWAVSQRVTHFVAISQTIQRRIAECYGRSSVIIPPPVDTNYYTPGPAQREDFYLCVSACAPYKRLDLAVQVCNRLQRQLIVIGSGQEEKRLRKLAGPTVQLLGWQPDSVVRDHLQRCRALIFPGEEDFGIVPVEALACGTPVIAFEQGGATETLSDLGFFFEHQNEECLASALEEFELQSNGFDPAVARQRALHFSAQHYFQRMTNFLHGVLGGNVKAPLAA